MRTIPEILLELQHAINANLHTLHHLKDLAESVPQNKPDEQLTFAQSISTIWTYLKPVHGIIREQNPTRTKFYDEIDKFIVEQEKRSLDVKNLATPEVVPPKKKVCK